MKKTYPHSLLALFLMVGLISYGCASPQKNQTKSQINKAVPKVESTVTMATTTSTQDSGLLDYLLPKFEKQYKTRVKVVAVGSGQAIETGRRGDADVLLVHSPADEEKFVKEGQGIDRRNVMHNQFLLIGPTNDPAKVTSAKNVIAAMKAIADTKSSFVSRGDASGTNKKELSLWKTANITPKGAWYVVSSQGMGETLLMTNEKQAYTLTDEATYLVQRSKLNLKVVRQGDPELLNPYSVILVNQAKHPGVHKDAAQAFADWVTSENGQNLIADFGKDKYGKSLFIPDAKAGK
ncbi:MAG: substrate-binding domain-containing protein [Candidatus Saccharibacteria bacterium]